MSSSSDAVTETVFAVRQSVAVKVKVAGLTVTSVPDGTDSVMVTSPAGSDINTTWYVAVSPSPTVRRTGVTLTPAGSSSSIVTVVGVEGSVTPNGNANGVISNPS